MNLTIQIVAPVPEEEVGTEEVTPLLTEDSNSGESYEASPDEFCCNKVGHYFWDEECEMYDLEFLNLKGGPARASLNWQVPGARKACKSTGAKVSQ